MYFNTTNRIPTFIVNLKKRQDRKAHILKEFDGRDEFAVDIVEALENSDGALGLWSTIRHILLDRMSGQDEFILIGEDDIEFTEHYSKEYLFQAIEEAQQKNADVLLGGISWFSRAVQISDTLFWANSFTGTHFTIIFKKFYSKLITTPFHDTSADFKMAALSNDILFMYPFVAIQKDFGYSDATEKNNVEGRVASLFKSASSRASRLKSVKENFIKICDQRVSDEQAALYDNISLPTYLINPINDVCESELLKHQFKNRPEFDLNFIGLRPHESAEVSLWLTMSEIVTQAIANNDDVIVVCKPGHRFADGYSKNYLIQNIIEAHEEGADLLFGGVASFNSAVPLTNNRFWISCCTPLNFMVIYSKFYPVVIESVFNEAVLTKRKFPYGIKLVNTMLLFPFITRQADELIGPLTWPEQQIKNKIVNCTAQLQALQQALIKYSQS